MTIVPNAQNPIAPASEDFRVPANAAEFLVRFPNYVRNFVIRWSRDRYVELPIELLPEWLRHQQALVSLEDIEQTVESMVEYLLALAPQMQTDRIAMYQLTQVSGNKSLGFFSYVNHLILHRLMQIPGERQSFGVLGQHAA